jgi:hypothetical protein
MLKVYVDDKFFGFLPKDDQTRVIFRQKDEMLYVYQETDEDCIVVFSTNKPYILLQE